MSLIIHYFTSSYVAQHLLVTIVIVVLQSRLSISFEHKSHRMYEPTDDERSVLAAETFFRSYQGSREIGESVINFDTPVKFTKIEILSSSMFVSTSNGGLMFGVTEPSRFTVEFLCNNVGGSDELTLHDLGTLDYEEDLRTRFICTKNIWTDKLIVSGRFSAITVVVYGSPKDTEVESVQRKDPRCNLPPMPLSNGVPDVMSLTNNRDDSNLNNESSDLDSNYY